MNPILTGFHPDPSICRLGNDFFLATSSFEYFPGVPIYHSRDLVNWRLIGHALNRRSQLDLRSTEAGGGVWAPTLRCWKGRFYLATSVIHVRSAQPRQPESFYVWTDDIWSDSSWSDPIFLDQVGIDQDLFFDDDERVYLSTARYNRGPRQGIGSKQVTYGVEIDLKSGRSLQGPELLRRAPGIGSVAEGGHIIKRGSWYYLFTAEGGTGPGHHVFVTRSNHPLGPYEEPPEGVNPVVCNGNHPTVQRTGHADFVQDKDGNWWAVMLAVRMQTGSTFQLGRETFLAPVDWSEDGWPAVNRGRPITVDIPALLPDRIGSSNWMDNFDKGSLEGWYTLRTPTRPCYTFDHRPSTLTIFGNAHTIQHNECPAALFRKQIAYAGTWLTSLNFEPKDQYEEAGTAVFYNGNSFAAILLRQGTEGKEVELRWTDPFTRLIRSTSQLIQSNVAVVLVITAEPDQYHFAFRIGESDEVVQLGSLPAQVLDGGSEKEFEFYFTGAHFVIFSQGVDGAPVTTPAHFDYAQFIQS